MTDIVERLRATQDDWPATLVKLELEAADEIERLRWALEFILGVDRINDAHVAARAALGEGKE